MIVRMETSSGTIRHPGIIEKVEGERIMVKILAQSACTACHAKNMCNVAEVEEKVVEVREDQPNNWKAGMQVTVVMRSAMGLNAVFLGYILPLVVLAGSLALFVSVLGSEGLAAILSLAFTAGYFSVLYLFRDRLKKKFKFSIESF